MKWTATKASFAGMAAVAAVGLGGLPSASAMTTATSGVTPSDNSAGYSASHVSPVTSFVGTVNVPTVTCPNVPDPGPALGAQIDVSDPSAQYAVDMSWQGQCFGGIVSWSLASASVLGPGGSSAATVNISSGNVLRFTAAVDSVHRTVTAKVINLTTGYSSTATGAVAGSLTAIVAQTFFPAAGPGPVTPIPSFSPIRFGSLKFNGQTLSAWAPTRYEMYDGSTLQVATSLIRPRGSFTTTFKHA